MVGRQSIEGARQGRLQHRRRKGAKMRRRRRMSLSLLPLVLVVVRAQRSQDWQIASPVPPLSGGLGSERSPPSPLSPAEGGNGGREREQREGGGRARHTLRGPPALSVQQCSAVCVCVHLVTEPPSELSSPFGGQLLSPASSLYPTPRRVLHPPVTKFRWIIPRLREYWILFSRVSHPVLSLAAPRLLLPQGEGLSPLLLPFFLAVPIPSTSLRPPLAIAAN